MSRIGLTLACVLCAALACATGNPTLYTNPIAQQIAYGYDDAGRLTLVNYPTGTDTAFAYDSAGRPNTMTDGTGVTDWDFNAASELTRLTTPQGIMDYTYTLAGERASMIEQGVGTTSYQYWNDGRLKQLTNPYGETTVWNYDPAGRLTKRTLGSGMYETYAYDVRSRLTSTGIRKADTTLLRWRGYWYDAASNVVTEQLNSVVTNYTYDFADQLLSENRTGHSTAYTYDSNGNRSTRNLNGVLETYSYDAGDKLLSVSSLAGNKTYTYEAGRVKTITTPSGTSTFGYDYEGRITSASLVGGGTNAFGYNALNARTSKTDSSGTRTYKRDGAYVTDPVLSDGAANYTPTISERRSGTTTYLHSGLKNADAQSNFSQTVSGTKSYDAFGETTASTGTWSGPFGYAGGFGYQQDSDSSLMLLGHRYYDPSIGRFFSRDPVGDGQNWYAYTSNEPVSYYDGDGLQRRNANSREKYELNHALVRLMFWGRIAAASALDDMLWNDRILVDPTLPDYARELWDGRIVVRADFIPDRTQYTNRDPILREADYQADVISLASVLYHENIHSGQGWKYSWNKGDNEGKAYGRQLQWLKEVLDQYPMHPQTRRWLVKWRNIVNDNSKT